MQSFGSLSIARIFGGFPKLFFTTYHEYFPKAEPVGQYDLRMELYELFHYLNHTLIFGVSFSRTFMNTCINIGYVGALCENRRNENG